MRVCVTVEYIIISNGHDHRADELHERDDEGAVDDRAHVVAHGALGRREQLVEPPFLRALLRGRPVPLGDGARDDHHAHALGTKSNTENIK